LIFIEFSPWCLDSDLIGGFMPPSTDGSWRLRQSYGPLANVTALGSFANDELGLDGGPDHRHGRQGSGKSLRFYILVRPEKEVTDKDRAEVQSNMQSKVLESNMYPDIVFRSTEVRRTGALVWGVSGDLTLHGVTKPVSVDVTRQNDAYVGTVRIKQSEFGIQPIKIGGRVVRVKDELEISFRVYTASR
jgi:hypothetical protein